MRTTSILTFLAFGVLFPLVPAEAAPGSRHDGSVASIDTASRRIVIHELVANARPVDRAVRVSPDARIVVSDRNEHALDFSHEFTEHSIRLSEVHRGDFVVLDVTGTGPQARADSLIVTLRGGA